MFYSNFLRLCNSVNKTPSAVAKEIGISKSIVSRWKNGGGVTDVVAQRIADYFCISMSELMQAEEKQGKEMHRIPVLGSVPAGIPIEAIEDVIDWEELPDVAFNGGKTYFALKVKGDSMYPIAQDGDIAIIRKTPVCDNGDTCVVYVNGADATLKQVKLYEDGSLTLMPRNPEYSPRTFTAEEVKALPVTIAGVVAEFRRPMKGW